MNQYPHKWEDRFTLGVAVALLIAIFVFVFLRWPQ